MWISWTGCNARSQNVGSGILCHLMSSLPACQNISPARCVIGFPKRRADASRASSKMKALLLSRHFEGWIGTRVGASGTRTRLADTWDFSPTLPRLRRMHTTNLHGNYSDYKLLLISRIEILVPNIAVYFGAPPTIGGMHTRLVGTWASFLKSCQPLRRTTLLFLHCQRAQLY